MNRSTLKKIVTEIEQENVLFSDKSILDNLTFPKNIIGRQEEVKEFVRLLLGHKKGLVVPFISVYGKSGTGKSSVVRFVCENLDDILYAFVNLRKAKTVFGCANLILSELGMQNLKSAQGINTAIELIGKTIESLITQKKKSLFVLVLDELDVLFYDKRGKPSDFIYKLVVLVERLREKGVQFCIIGVSNNVVSDYELDDRVRSRIGSSDVFFGSYKEKDVLEILEDRAKDAFSKIDPPVLEYCANLSSLEHGDARRAIDLLRVGAEIAGRQNEVLSKKHIDLASSQLQKDRLSQILSSASYHLRLACSVLARITYLTGEPWHSTSTLYKQYCNIIAKDTKPLTYRRVSELLTELENTGIAVSQTGSRGRHGYGTQYRLLISPEMIGRVCFPEWWNNLEKQKVEHEAFERFRSIRPRHSSLSRLSKSIDMLGEENWKNFVGL